ncbi:MAG: hypothetical protein PHR87_08990 [Sulfurospirillaceae bacterium]|nr:hypothetical protein [Sulfurospirillaceae bacterium]
MHIQSIPVSSLIALDTPQKKIFDLCAKDIEDILQEPSEAQRQQALEQQAQIKAHTIYSVGNSIIGVLWADGSSNFGSNSSKASEAINDAYNSNELQNLKGEALVEKLAQIIDKAFSKYNSGVDTKTYRADNAPTQGYLSYQIDWMQDYPLPINSSSSIYA